jgi:hypothetical protein
MNDLLAKIFRPNFTSDKDLRRIRQEGWIGVDLDGTLAHYDGWVSIESIGDPIPAMVDRVRHWIAEGNEVRIFTARVTVHPDKRNKKSVEKIRELIQDWTEKHIGHRLIVTNIKDFGLRELWDDRAVRVEENTGMPCCNFRKE